MGAREPHSAHLALDAPDPEPSGDEDAVRAGQRRLRAVILGTFVRLHPDEVDLRAVGESAGPDGLGHRQVGVGQLDILTHQRDRHLLARLVNPLEEFTPHGPVDVAERQTELAHHVRVELLGVEHLGDVVDGRGVRCRDDAFDLHVAHEGDLVLEGLGHVAVAAQDQRVGLDTDVAQGGHRVLSGLGLELTRRRQVRHQGHVQEEHVVAADIVADLASGLDERLRLDVTDGAPDLGDDHIGDLTVGVGLAHRPDAILDLVGDVRDHLNRVAEVFTAAFFRDDSRIHLSGGHIRESREVAVEESFVVTDVEVGLGAIFCDEHLTVLERIHRARIHVQIWIELLHRDAKAASCEQLAEARSRQAFAE